SPAAASRDRPPSQGTCHRHARVTSPDFELVAEHDLRKSLLVGGYGQFCPVERGAEVFAERWTPLIIRELLRGPAHFNELRRGLPRISRSLLSERLGGGGRGRVQQTTGAHACASY